MNLSSSNDTSLSLSSLIGMKLRPQNPMHSLASLGGMKPQTHLCMSYKEARDLQTSLKKLWPDSQWHIISTYRIDNARLLGDPYLVSPQSSESAALDELYASWKRISDTVHALPAVSARSIAKERWIKIIAGTVAGFFLWFAAIHNATRPESADPAEPLLLLWFVPGSILGLYFIHGFVKLQR